MLKGKGFTVWDESNLSIQHQFGKLMAGSIASFVALKLAEKAYDKTLLKNQPKDKKS